MASGHEHTDQLFGDLPLGKEHPEYLMPEDLLQVLAHNDRSDPKGACAYEAAIRAQNVTVGLNPKKSPKCLDGDYSAWHGVLPRYRTSQIHLESFPGAAAQLREQFAVVYFLVNSLTYSFLIRSLS